jgi:hypothetical protein
MICESKRVLSIFPHPGRLTNTRGTISLGMDRTNVMSACGIKKELWEYEE